MPLAGQASGGWTESSSALRLLHVGIRNTVGILTADGFTQTNPVTATIATNTSAGFDGAILGVLSGSVAFTRGDQGPNEIGGPDGQGGAVGAPTAGIVELGLFINTAAGNDYENQPAVASDKCPYVSGQGTYASQLFETNCAAGGAVTYQTGQELYASLNGYLICDDADTTGIVVAANDYYRRAAAVVMGILKMPADAVQPEIVFDQRI